MTIRTHTFQVNGATIVVREPKGVDRIDQRIVYGKLSYDRNSEQARNRVVNFAEYVARTVSVEGELGYAWATINSSENDMQAAFDGWQEWPTALMDTWAGALYTVSEAPGDRVTQPDVDPNA